ncbi:MAG: type VI secretion system contractile sheath small subunit [Gemmataceae bacterium]
MAESLQHKLDRVRRPRVQITYDVEDGGAMKKVELPYVVGVMADLSADNAANLPAIKERKFDEIDRDNFNDRLKAAAPEVSFRVDNKLAGDGSQMPVKLKFENMDDFSPANVAQQVEPLRRLLEERQRLNEVLGKMESSQKLEDLLGQVLANTEKVQELAKQMGVDAAGNPPKEA